MSAPAGAPVLDLRMCDNPDCGGYNACDRIRKDKRTMALAIWGERWLPDNPEFDALAALRIIAQELVTSGASDSHGALHMVPEGCQFTVHKGGGYLPEEDRQYGRDCYVAVYSGPDVDLDDLLAGSPLWSDDLVAERLGTLKAA